MSDEIELLEVPGKWDIPYRYTAGETASRFFKELKENARIMGTKCPSCERVLLPPRAFCEWCFISIKDNWVEVKPEGTLETFTIVTERFDYAPEPPYVICYVRLGEAYSTIPHFLTGIKLDDLEEAKQHISIGMRVKAMFKEKDQREGRIQDFRIEPAGE